MGFRHFVVLCALFIASSATAQFSVGTVDVPLATVNSDGGDWPNQSSQLVLEVDPTNGALQYLRVEQPGNNILRFSMEQLLSPSAVVTITRTYVSKHILLLQILTPFDALQGGVVRIIMMREYGIFNDDYRVLDVGLVRTTAGGWALARGRDAAVGGPYAITGIYFTSRHTGADEVGIDRADLYNGAQAIESFDTAILPGPGAALFAAP